MRHIEFLANPTVGEVRIGCPDFIAGALLLPLVRQFCLEYPRIASCASIRCPPARSTSISARAASLDLKGGRVSTLYARDPFGEDLKRRNFLFHDPNLGGGGGSTNSRWARRRKIDFREGLAYEPWVSAPRWQRPWRTMAMEQAFKASNLPIPTIRVTTFSFHRRDPLRLTPVSFLTAMPRSLSPRLSADGIRLEGAAGQVADPKLSGGHRDPQEPHPESGGYFCFSRTVCANPRETMDSINLFSDLAAADDRSAPRQPPAAAGSTSLLSRNSGQTRQFAGQLFGQLGGHLTLGGPRRQPRTWTRKRHSALVP